MKQGRQEKSTQKFPNGLEAYYKNVDGRKLRLGYTTGSCAAAAAKAAAKMLLTEEPVYDVKLLTPRGISLHLEVLDITWGKGYVSCAIQKDAGDDPDVTDGILVYAKVSKKQQHAVDKIVFAGNDFRGADVTCSSKERIRIAGGPGVGLVTKPGLEQPQGAWAINQTPRKMIVEQLEQICQEYHYSGVLEVTISVPEGEALAKKTFNPRLGIVGGISILGTTGIVEPMSETALLSSIRLELQQQSALGRKSLLITPGNYGQAFLQRNFPFLLHQGIKCSNFVGETIEFAAEFGMENLLFVAHIGKFIKVAGGIFQTHSRIADARMEILTANAALAGAGQSILTEIMEAVTTEEGIQILQKAGYLEQTIKYVMERIQFHFERRSFGKLNLGAVVFSSELGKRTQGSGELGRTANVEEIIQKIKIEINQEE